MNGKRLLDLGLGSIAFVVALPILGVIALAMRLMVYHASLLDLSPLVRPRWLSLHGAQGPDDDGADRWRAARRPSTTLG